MDTIFILSCIYFGICIFSAFASMIFNVIQSVLEDLDQYNFINVLIRKYFHVK